MLRLLAQFASFSISIFLAVLTGIFLITEEDAFPRGAGYTASLDFSQAQQSKEELISGLSTVADNSGLALAKVVADPSDFFNSRSLYVFGNDAPSTPRELTWFKPGMRGQERSASELGNTPLNGVYVFSGPESATNEFTTWLAEHRIEQWVTEKSTLMLLQQALISTGAWLAFLACMILSVAVALTWYALRARARSLKVLCGAPVRLIIFEDLASLGRAVAGPAVLAWAASLLVVALLGRTTQLPHFALVSAGLITGALTLMSVCALLLAALTWPSVAGIASRQPPERHFRSISEVLKAATLVLVAVVLPVVGASITEATRLANQDAQWALLKEHVSVRMGFRSEEAFVQGQAEMWRMAKSAQDAGHLTLSYAVKAETLPRATGNTETPGDYDGVVWADESYLRTVAPLIGSSPSSGSPLGDLGEQVTLETLPGPLHSYVMGQYPLLNREGRNLRGFDKHVRLFRYAGAPAFPALATVEGTMDHFKSPLILVVDDPAEAFNDQNLAALMTSGNAAFDDAAWVREYLDTHPIGSKVLSVDRVSDAALYNSQLQNQSAWLKTLTVLLVVLALIMSTSVSAMIHALATARRAFAQRTAGWHWRKVLTRRLAWEGAVVVGIGLGMFAALGAGTRLEVWWVLAAIPLYAAISTALHVTSARTVFAKTLARIA